MTRYYLYGISIVLLLLISLLIPPNPLKLDTVWATAGRITTIPVYMITTRNGSGPPIGEPGAGYDGRPLGNITQLKTDCPSEIAIFVHGWQNDDHKAKERLDRVRLSLINNSYSIPLVGLSWPSDMGWDNAKLVAKQNGPKLADFIEDYVYDCKHQYHKDSSIRLIGHSLGARVILSALDDLHKNPTWTGEGFKILSVHLMGAAVDNEEVSKDPSDITGDLIIKSAYGNAIQEEVIRFYNLYSPEDNMLQPLPFSPGNQIYQVYPYFENDSALG
ncbi:MAG: alpha/beta hydrolase, partial [Thermoproteota archaeon]|nr:alpha/beta hydrolase [Thermoproteota archaeon]